MWAGSQRPVPAVSGGAEGAPHTDEGKLAGPRGQHSSTSPGIVPRASKEGLGTTDTMSTNHQVQEATSKSVAGRRGSLTAGKGNLVIDLSQAGHEGGWRPLPERPAGVRERPRLSRPGTSQVPTET